VPARPPDHDADGLMPRADGIESPHGGKFQHMRKPVQRISTDHDADGMLPRSRRPESPVGATRNTLRRPVPSSRPDSPFEAYEKARLDSPLEIDSGASEAQARARPGHGDGKGEQPNVQQTQRTRRGTSPHNVQVPESARKLVHVFDRKPREPARNSERTPSSKRNGVVGQRILGQLLGQKERLRQVLPVMDAHGKGCISFEDFTDGLRTAGVRLGAADRYSVWADVGGSFLSRGCDAGEGRAERVPDGEIDIANFLTRLDASVESENWGGKKMQETGYSQHMRSSLTKGYMVRDDVEQFDTTGGGMHLRRGIAPAQRAQVQDAEPGDAGTSARGGGRWGGTGSTVGSATMRWSKNEEHYRELIKQRKGDIKRLFHAKAGDKAGTDDIAMTFTDLKTGLRSAGVTLCDNDYELLWRRVDAECVGLVKYEHIATAFELTDRCTYGEPGMHAGKPSRALPHFSGAAEAAASPQRTNEMPLARERQDVVLNLVAERIARDLVIEGSAMRQSPESSINHKGGKHHFVDARASAGKRPPDAQAWQLVKDCLATCPPDAPLSVDTLHRALASAGTLVSKEDCLQLWHRARYSAAQRHDNSAAAAAAAGGGTGAVRPPSPTIRDLDDFMAKALRVQTPSKLSPALLSYGSRVAMSVQAHEGGGARGGEQGNKKECGRGEQQEGLSNKKDGGQAAAAAAAMDKLLGGFLGNPHRLRQVLKKYDPDLQGCISRQEFEHGLAAQWTSLSQHEVNLLGAALQDKFGVVRYEEVCAMVAHRNQASAHPCAGQNGAGVTHEGNGSEAVPAAATGAAYAQGGPRRAHGKKSFQQALDPVHTGDGPVGAPQVSSVQREASSASMRSIVSTVPSARSTSSVCLAGNMRTRADRASWMKGSAALNAHNRMTRSSSPAPTRARPGSPAPDAAAERAAVPSSPPAAKSVQFQPIATDAAPYRILHLTGGPPLAMHRGRHSIAVG
jgi:hypothetical protein